MVIGQFLSRCGKSHGSRNIPDNETAENAEAPTPLSTRVMYLCILLSAASRLPSGRDHVPETSLAGL